MSSSRRPINATDAGCAIVHIHARDPETGFPTTSLEVLGAIVKGISDKCPIVINLSTAIGIGASPDERIAGDREIQARDGLPQYQLHELRPGRLEIHTILGETVFTNTFDMLVRYAKTMKECGTKPELEVYDLGGIYNTMFVRHQGIFVEPMHFQFVWGVLGGCAWTWPTSSVSWTSSQMTPPGVPAGVGPAQFRGAMIAAAEGGHIRVGLEDNITVSKGVMAQGSYEQVRKAAKIVALADREPATPDETRQILKLKGGPEL